MGAVGAITNYGGTNDTNTYTNTIRLGVSAHVSLRGTIGGDYNKKITSHRGGTIYNGHTNLSNSSITGIRKLNSVIIARSFLRRKVHSSNSLQVLLDTFRRGLQYTRFEAAVGRHRQQSGS